MFCFEMCRYEAFWIIYIYIYISPYTHCVCVFSWALVATGRLCFYGLNEHLARHGRIFEECTFTVNTHGGWWTCTTITSSRFSSEINVRVMQGTSEVSLHYSRKSNRTVILRVPLVKRNCSFQYITVLNTKDK